MQTKSKQSIKSLVATVIIAELLLMASACYFIYYTSWTHIVQRRGEAVTMSVTSFDTDDLVADAGKSFKKASESISEEMEETVWATEDVNFRTGPDESYESEGVLGIYTAMTRTGVTYNDWSRVTVYGEDYYVLSEYLTTEAPLITATGAKGEYQRYALSLLSSYGWDDSEITPLINLWNRESGWNPNSHNKSSGAHGIPQALPASKMAAFGSDYYTNGNTQIRWGLNYIANRYGSPSAAWRHFQSHNWY